MSNYKYYIKANNGKYYFGLYPNNSNIQPIARSKAEYGTYAQADRARILFQTLIASDKDIANRFVVEQSSKGFTFHFEDSEGKTCVYRTKIYATRTECLEGISRLINNINAPLKSEKV